MKKLIILSLIGILFTGSLFAQPGCVRDTWYTLQNNQIPKAKLQIDKCYKESPNDAHVLLMRGNVYLRRHNQEVQALKNNPKYEVKDSNAILIANESFYQSMQVNPNIKPMGGFDGKQGQINCADVLVSYGITYYKKDMFENAEEYFTAAIRSYRAGEEIGRLGDVYYNLAMVKNKQKDDAGFVENLKLAASYKVGNAFTYEFLSADALKKGDTTASLKFITDGLRNVKDSTERNDLALKEINHYVMLEDTAKINKAIGLFFEKQGRTPLNIANGAQILTNAGLFDQALSLLTKANEEYKDNLDITKGLAYSYLFYSIKFQDDAKELLKKEPNAYDKVGELQSKQKEMQMEAFNWAQKALKLKPDDEESLNRVKQLKAVLGID